MIINFDLDKLKSGLGEEGALLVLDIIEEHPEYNVSLITKLDLNLDMFWNKDITTIYTDGIKTEIDCDFDVILGDFELGLLSSHVEIFNDNSTRTTTLAKVEPTYSGGNAVVFKDKIISDDKGNREERKMLYILIV